MPVQQISNSFVVEIDGQPLGDDLDLVGVTVNDHLRLPDAFELRFRDSSRQVLPKAGAKIGASVKVSVLSDAAPSDQSLISGEITAVEALVHGGTSFTIARGYDESHRLTRGTTTESYQNMTFSDAARRVADRNGLKVGTIDESSPTLTHITQANEDDWSFLWRMANEIGYEVEVEDKALNFRRATEAEAPPPLGDLDTDDPLLLLLGSNLLYLRATVTAAEQVKEVQVRSWDPDSKKALVATAATSTKAVDNSSSPAQLSETFPGPRLVSGTIPFATSQQVEAAASGLAEAVAASYAELEGEARGSAKLAAGAAVRVGLVGDPFDGTYVLTSTTHRYNAEEGYVTTFVISGRQERSLFDLTNASGPVGESQVLGVVPALVDDVDDPKGQCRVRVRFPWLDDTFVSDWSRVAQPGAGKDRGFVILPEVDDEVLVAFEHGDPRRPFVVGGLYNGQDTPNTGPGDFLDGSTRAVNNRLFTSRLGHQMVFIDADEKSGVVLTSGDAKLEIRLDQANQKIVIRSGGDLEISADGDIKMNAQGSITANAQRVSVEAENDFGAKGSQVTIQGSGPVQIQGQPIELN